MVPHDAADPHCREPAVLQHVPGRILEQGAGKHRDPSAPRHLGEVHFCTRAAFAAREGRFVVRGRVMATLACARGDCGLSPLPC
eukprot:15474121-Alexandrium_andersonii.AAC.1